MERIEDDDRAAQNSRHHDVASDEGGKRAAAVYSLIETCKMNDVDPRAWLADVLAKLPDYPAHRVGELLPWAWKARRKPPQAPRPPSPRSRSLRIYR